MIRIVNAAVLLVGICWAPVARADAEGDQAYLDSIHQNYFSSLHTDSVWLAEARKICSLHLAGADADELMDMVQADLIVPDTVSPTVVGAAEGALGC